MIIKGITDEDFVNYQKPSMFIAFPTCTFKCCIECGKDVCQNSELAKAKDIEVTEQFICERYMSNPITKAIVLGGLEPFDSKFDLIRLIDCLRNQFNCDDDVVIYTGYKRDEIDNVMLEDLRKFGNIIVKWGRFVPDEQSHTDPILGVSLMSRNQFAERL